MTWWLQKTDKKGGGIDFFKKHITKLLLICNGRKVFGLDVAIPSKSSLRGETLVSTRQSICALATIVSDKWIATGCAFAMTNKVTRRVPQLSLQKGIDTDAAIW